MARFKVTAVKYDDYEADDPPPSKLTVSIPTNCVGDALAERDAITVAIEDKTGCTPIAFNWNELCST
jgi:hypothetical protein